MVAKHFESVALWIGIDTGVFVSHKDVLHETNAWHSLDRHIAIEVFNIVQFRADKGFGSDRERVAVAVQGVRPASYGDFNRLASINVAAKSARDG